MSPPLFFYIGNKIERMCNMIVKKRFLCSEKGVLETKRNINRNNCSVICPLLKYLCNFVRRIFKYKTFNNETFFFFFRIHNKKVRPCVDVLFFYCLNHVFTIFVLLDGATKMAYHTPKNKNLPIYFFTFFRFMVNLQQPFPAWNHLYGAMFIGQCAFFVVSDDDAPTARMHIWKFLQWFFLPFLCFRIGY